jgi:hypothetical protein
MSRRSRWTRSRRPPSRLRARRHCPGGDPDELRERARQLHEEAGDQARAAAELRDAAAALRGEAAALLERVPELAAEAAPAREDPGAAPVGFDAPLAEPPAEASAPRRRWFRRRR